jgi:sigma-54 dependent transcriptional regulator, acetoin dehydrogenase operon transcriptional activator AcoR
MIDAHRAKLAEDDPGSLMVRSEILDSWRRSKLSGVDPDRVRTVAHEACLDSRIAKTAIPVLVSAADALIGAHTSLLLSSPDGTLLWRWDGDRRLKKRLDRSNVHPGYVMSEDVVGTNGLGTALETARSVLVSGTEHFSEAFHDFTCAGAPVRHPVTNRVTGVLSLTTLVEDASPLMAPTLLRLSQDIEEELYGESTMHERQMLRHFLAERRRVRSAVLAVSADVVIANSIATAMDFDNSALWQRIEDSPGDMIGLELAAGSHITVCRPVRRGGQLVGAVVVAEETALAASAGERVARGNHARASMPVREERSWVRLVSGLRTVAATTDRLLVVGEDGVGKRAALRAVVADSGRGYRELDCATLEEVGREQWLGEARSFIASADELVVLAHLDALDASSARALASILDTSDRGPRDALLIAGTVAGAALAEGTLSRMLLDQFPPDPFEVLPLRKRVDDALARLVDQGIGMPALSREAVQLIERHPWPGNHRQLEQFRQWMARQDRPLLTPGDLPASWRGDLTRGNLTSMQVAEVEAIASALRQNSGNKVAAATSLGISRSSLYRKMREYRLH